MSAVKLVVLETDITERWRRCIHCNEFQPKAKWHCGSDEFEDMITIVGGKEWPDKDVFIVEPLERA